MDQELMEINQKCKSQVASDNSRNAETLIAIGANDFGGANGKSNESLPNKGVIEDKTANMEREDRCSSCSIDADCNDLVGEVQRVCRICHLSSKESGKSTVELMELGCGCKGELGLAHLHCAEAWFRVKGNRLCEICGEAAKNITGASDNEFMEEWNERRLIDGGNDTSDGSRRCFHGQPLCNLLMACLVITFILPWFFQANMF